MSHPFGDLLSQHLHRKHGLSQSKLAAGILQDPAIIGKMCKGERLSGRQARERVIAIIGWLHKETVLTNVVEANSLLQAAGMASLQDRNPLDAVLLQQLEARRDKRAHAQLTPRASTVSLPDFLVKDEPLAEPATIFVGRKRELETLAEALEKVNGGHGQIRFVTGGAGQGKSALVQEFARQAQAKNHALLAITGYCNAYTGAGDPYLPFRELLALLAGDVETQWVGGRIPVESARRLWNALPTTLPAVVDHAPDLIGPFLMARAMVKRAELIASPDAAWFNQLVALTTNTQNIPLEGRRIFSQFTAALRAIAKEQPLLIILEDLHWVDVGSGELLFHLSRAIGDSPIFIVGTYRPDEVALGQGVLRNRESHPLASMLAEFKRQHGAIWLDLDAMSAWEGRHFVEEYVDSQPNRLDIAFRTALFEHTGGHALFTVELLRELQARGDLQQDERGRWVAERAIDWHSLPAKVEGVIEKHLASLDATPHAILRTASVQGDNFAAEIIAQVLHLDEEAVAQYLSQELGRKRRLVSSRDAAWLGQQRLSGYSFRHHLFQRYLYQSLDEMERTYLHRATAQALERIYAPHFERCAADLAYHFYQAGLWEQALHYSMQAGDEARSLYALRPAIEHYTRAFEAARHLDSSPPIVLYRARGLTYEMLGDFRPALSDLEMALRQAEIAQKREIEWQALLDLGALWAGQNYEQTGRYYQRAFELAQRMDDPATLANSLNRLGNWNLNRERPLEGIHYHRQALAIFQQLQDDAGIADTLDFLGMASLMAGDLVQGTAYYRQAVELFYTLDQRQGLISSLTSLTNRAPNFQTDTMIPGADKLSDAVGDVEAAHKLAKEIGHRSGEIYTMHMLAKCVGSQGAYQRAFDLLEQCLILGQEIEHQQWITAGHFTLGALYAEVLAFPEAVDELQQAMAGARAIQSPHWLLNTVGFLAMSYVQQGEFAQAESLLQAHLDLEEPVQKMVQRLMWRAHTELALARGEGTQALQAVDRLLSSAANLTPGRVIPRLAKLRGDALLLLGQYALAESELLTARKVARQQEAFPLVWRIHASLAHLYQEQARLNEAEEERSAARTLIEEIAVQVPERLRTNFYHKALNCLVL